jgi:hypothetical protein
MANFRCELPAPYFQCRRWSGYPPKLTVEADIPDRQRSANNRPEQVQQTTRLFNYLVGTSEQPSGDPKIGQ